VLQILIGTEISDGIQVKCEFGRYTVDDKETWPKSQTVVG
jgi:hypothetical protein